MKYRKIFIFILLLCTIFGTSFGISSIVSANVNDITNLYGTIWEFNENLDSSWYGKIDNILFSDAEEDLYTSIEIGENPDTGLMYVWYTDINNNVVQAYDLDYGWVNTDLQVITFESNITDTYFVSWVKSNASLIDSGIYLPDLYFDNYDPASPIVSTDDVYYQINNDGVWHPIVDSDKNLPYSVSRVSSIKFKNESTTLDLVVYQSFDLLWEVFSETISPNFSITSSFDMNFIMRPHDPSVDPGTGNKIIKGQYRFNDEVTWLYDISEQEGVLNLPFYLYHHYSPVRVNYNYMLADVREDLSTTYFFYANEDSNGDYIGQYAGIFTTSTTINMYEQERIVYFNEQTVSNEVYNWLTSNGVFINDPTLDPNNPNNPDSDNNPNNPNNPDFGTETFRQIVNQVNTFLGLQLLPGLAFRDLLLISLALPILMYILKVFLGG